MRRPKRHERCSKSAPDGAASCQQAAGCSCSRALCSFCRMRKFASAFAHIILVLDLVGIGADAISTSLGSCSSCSSSCCLSTCSSCSCSRRTCCSRCSRYSRCSSRRHSSLQVPLPLMLLVLPCCACCLLFSCCTAHALTPSVFAVITSSCMPGLPDGEPCWRAQRAAFLRKPIASTNHIVSSHANARIATRFLKESHKKDTESERSIDHDLSAVSRATLKYEKA